MRIADNKLLRLLISVLWLIVSFTLCYVGLTLGSWWHLLTLIGGVSTITSIVVLRSEALYM